MDKFRQVHRHPEFIRDLKQLTKRFRTLEEDLEKLIDYSICLRHKQGIDNGGIVQIPGLGFEHPPVYKVKKFACKSLKGKGAQSGLRLIYAYFKDDDRIELIEIYFKEKQNTNCNKVRIQRLYSA
jgi:mRNA-degrading endonuclease RelE of RelBE toxin-antitoxin system